MVSSEEGDYYEEVGGEGDYYEETVVEGDLYENVEED